MKITIIFPLVLTFLSFAHCKNGPKDPGDAQNPTSVITAQPVKPDSQAADLTQSAKNQEVNSKQPIPEKENPDSLPIKASQDDSYDLVAAFYSIGEGTDYKTIEKFNEFLTAYEGKVDIEKVPWGREGELDYCINLDKLSTGLQKDFIKNARAILEKSKLVHIYEDAKCRKKR